MNLVRKMKSDNSEESYIKMKMIMRIDLIAYKRKCCQSINELC